MLATIYVAAADAVVAADSFVLDLLLMPLVSMGAWFVGLRTGDPSLATLTLISRRCVVEFARVP